MAQSSIAITHRRQLLPPVPQGAEIDLLSLAPSGGRMAFVRRDEAGKGIYVATGRDQRSVRHIAPASPFGIEDLAWSPDGSHLAYVIGAPLGGRPAVAWAASASFGELGRVEGASFAWTPNGKALVVADCADKMVVRYDIRLGKGRQLAPLEDDMDPAFPPRLAISPDGKRIVVTAGRDGEDISEVWILHREGKKVVRNLFTEIPGAKAHIMPFWAPKRSTLALYAVHYEQQKSVIIVVPKLEGEGVILYESGLLDPPVQPVWSPSGHSIVFFRVDERDANDDGMGPVRLVVLDPRRETFVPITAPDELSGRLRFVDSRTLVVEGGASAHLLTVAGIQ